MLSSLICLLFIGFIINLVLYKCNINHLACDYPVIHYVYAYSFCSNGSSHPNDDSDSIDSNLTTDTMHSNVSIQPNDSNDSQLHKSNTNSISQDQSTHQSFVNNNNNNEIQIKDSSEKINDLVVHNSNIYLRNKFLNDADHIFKDIYELLINGRRNNININELQIKIEELIISYENN